MLGSGAEDVGGSEDAYGDAVFGVLGEGLGADAAGEVGGVGAGLGGLVGEEAGLAVALDLESDVVGGVVAVEDVGERGALAEDLEVGRVHHEAFELDEGLSERKAVLPASSPMA